MSKIGLLYRNIYKKNTIPQWQKDLSQWTNRKWFFTSVSSRTMNHGKDSSVTSILKDYEKVKSLYSIFRL